MKFEESSAVCVIDSHHGIYIGQIFAQQYEHELRKVLDEDKVEILLRGPDDLEYVEVWAELDGIELEDESGKKFRFCQLEGDMFEIPSEEWPKIDWENF